MSSEMLLTIITMRGRRKMRNIRRIKGGKREEKIETKREKEI